MRKSSLDHLVLVLNRLWQPVNIISAKDAYRHIFKESARVVLADGENFQILNAEDWMSYCQEHPPLKNEAFIRTVHFAMKIPTVILLEEYAQIPAREPRLSRENIFKRDGFRCQYTGKALPPEQLNIDHVIPKAKGGRSTWENLVTASVQINQMKANRLPHEAGLQLIKKPTRPRWRVFTVEVPQEECPVTWNYFIPKGAVS